MGNRRRWEALTLGLILALFTSLSNCTVPLGITVASDIGKSPNATRHVFYQSADGNLYLRSHFGAWREPRRIPATIPPRPGTPLAAWYRNESPDHDRLSLYYLDADGRIVFSTGHFNISDVSTFSWAGRYVTREPASVAASSNIAVLLVGGKKRIYYLDMESYVVEMVDGRATRIGPQALPASKLAVASPWGTENGDEEPIYVFFVSQDRSLSQMKYHGQSWSQVETIAHDFASSSSQGIHLAVTAWNNPPLVRVFYVGLGGKPSEFVCQNGSWVSNPNPPLPPIRAAVPGGPISATQGVRLANETFVELFFAFGHSIVNLVKKPGTTWMVGDFSQDATWFLPNVDERLSTSDRLTITFGIVTAVLSLLSLGSWHVWKRFHPPRNKNVEACPSRNGVDDVGFR